MDVTGIDDWPCTIFCWTKWSSAAATGISFIYIQLANPWNGITLGVNGTVGGDPLFANRFGVEGISTSSGTSGDTWYALGGRSSGTTNLTVVLDGTSTTAPTTSVDFPPVGADPTGGMVGGRSVSTPPTFQTSTALIGSVACCALWNVVLTDREMVALSKGLSPRKVRPSGLKFYSPLINVAWLNTVSPKFTSQADWYRSSFTSTPGGNPPTVVKGPPIRGI